VRVAAFIADRSGARQARLATGGLATPPRSGSGPPSKTGIIRPAPASPGHRRFIGRANHPSAGRASGAVAPYCCPDRPAARPR